MTISCEPTVQPVIRHNPTTLARLQALRVKYMLAGHASMAAAMGEDLATLTFLHQDPHLEGYVAYWERAYEREYAPRP